MDLDRYHMADRHHAASGRYDPLKQPATLHDLVERRKRSSWPARDEDATLAVTSPTTSPYHTEECTAVPLRPQRAALESVRAALLAGTGALQARHEKLARKVELMHAALSRGDLDAAKVAAGIAAACDVSRVSEVHRRLNSRRVQTVSLEAELRQCTDRLRFSTSVFERQQRELAMLRDDSAQRLRNSEDQVQSTVNLREDLYEAEQENAELSRKAKTEQLRAMMLHQAFEQEQERVGQSLEKAEAFLNDLVSAAEGNRQFEAREQAQARRCVAKLNELHHTMFQDETQAEARLGELRRELAVAKDALASSRDQRLTARDEAAAAQNAATFAQLEAEKHELVEQLAEHRRRGLGASLSSRRTEVKMLAASRELQVLQRRAAKVADDLCSVSEVLGRDSSGTVTGRRTVSVSVTPSASGRVRTLEPRLRLEHETALAVQAAVLRLAAELGRLTDPQSRPESPSGGGAVQAIGQLADQERRGLMSKAAAEHCAGMMRKELERLRAELSVKTRSRSKETGSVAGPHVSLELSGDLAAAALQRQVGAACASEHEMHCRLQEELFRERLASESTRLLRDQLSTVRGFLAYSNGTANFGASAAEPERQLGDEIQRHLAEIQHADFSLRESEARLEALQWRQQKQDEALGSLSRPSGIALLQGMAAATNGVTTSKGGIYTDGDAHGSSGDLARLRMQLQGLRAELDGDPVAGRTVRGR